VHAYCWLLLSAHCRLLAKLDFADMKFSLYFLGYASPEDVPDDPVDRARWMFGQRGTLELTHNWVRGWRDWYGRGV
jgi:hypothetical protein